jgi:site-specific DNA recombinase
LVINRLRSFLVDPTAILDAIDVPSGSQLIERGGQMAEELGAQPPDKVKATLIVLLSRVDVHADRIDISLSRQRLAKLLADRSIDLTMPNQKLDRASDDAVILTAPARLKRVGREMRMLVDGSDEQRTADPSLLRIIARAHDVQGRLGQNTKLTVHDIAREEGVTAAYLYNLLRLPWLAPDITTAIINGRQPRQLNAMTLMRKASQLPAEWAEQRTLLGF